MDEAMNAILFILIGMQIIVIPWSLDYILAAAFAIVIVLISRVIGVGIPISFYRIKNHIAKYTIRILTWSGLRGGISVALALSLYEYTKSEAGMSRDIVNLIIIMTYCVVLFSIVVQGLTVKKLFEKAATYEEQQGKSK